MDRGVGLGAVQARNIYIYLFIYIYIFIIQKLQPCCCEGMTGCREGQGGDTGFFSGVVLQSCCSSAADKKKRTLLLCCKHNRDHPSHSWLKDCLVSSRNKGAANFTQLHFLKSKY